MSTKIYNAYKFSDEFNQETYNRAIHFLQDMKNAYREYLVANMLKELPMPELAQQKSPDVYLARELKKDMESPERAYLSVELTASFVCWKEKIVFIFYSNSGFTSKFINEYLADKGLADWSYNNQVDDDFDKYEQDGRDVFWDEYLDEYIGRWSDISLEYTLFDSTDVYRVAYEMTKDL